MDESGLLRTLRSPAGIDLSSNDYLGLAHDPRIMSAMIAAVEREGVGSTGSRLLRGERDSFTALEERFARFKGAERALYYSSGYLANLAVMTTFAEADDIIVSDEAQPREPDRRHPALAGAARDRGAQRVVLGAPCAERPGG